MIVPRYVPGDWVAVVSDGVVAMVPARTVDRTVDRLWSSLREGGDLDEHLEVLMEDGLSSVPPFALVSLTEGGVHAIVRGAVEVLVDADDGEHQLDGSTVTTWHEARVGRARAVHVRAAGATSDGVSHPVLSGVVRASSVDVDLSREPAADGRRRLRVRDADEGSVDGSREREGGRRRAVEFEPTPTVPEPSSEPTPHEPEPMTDPGPADAPETGPTPHRVDDLAAWAPEAGTAASEPAPESSSDHDGLTVQSSDVATLRRQLPEWAGDAVPGPFSVPAPQAPPPAKIHLSSGLVIALNRPVLLGRAPQVSRVQNSQIPRLVTVASPNQDISRTHAEVRQDGEHVLVTDLRSTNGVLLMREGTGPQRLHPGEPTMVEPGVVVDLGEGVTFVVEHGP